MIVCEVCKESRFDLAKRARFPLFLMCDKCYEDFCDREDTFPSIKMELDENGEIKTFVINRVNQLKD